MGSGHMGGVLHIVGTIFFTQSKQLIHQSDKRWAICYLIGQIQRQATYNLVNGAGEEEDEEEEA